MADTDDVAVDAGLPDTDDVADDAGLPDTDDVAVDAGVCDGGVCGSQVKPDDKGHPHSDNTADRTVSELESPSYVCRWL